MRGEASAACSARAVQDRDAFRGISAKNMPEISRVRGCIDRFGVRRDGASQAGDARRLTADGDEAMAGPGVRVDRDRAGRSPRFISVCRRVGRIEPQPRAHRGTGSSRRPLDQGARKR